MIDLKKYNVDKIDSQWEFAVLIRDSNPVLCDKLEGWDGMGWDGRWEGDSRRRGYLHTYADSRCSAETNKIVKQLSSN